MTQQDLPQPDSPAVTPRSALFVPANRPERIPKALASGADITIVDLEDAVAAEAKPAARQALLTYLTQASPRSVWVRINADDDDVLEDLAICQDQPGVAGLVVPKAESPRALAQAAALGRPIMPLIESAIGLQRLDELARVEGIAQLSFGALDLGLDLGIDPHSEGGRWMLDQARYQLVLQSRLAGLCAPIETVHPEFRDTSVVAAAARRAVDMGFGGMLCIHPRQVEIVNAAFHPGDDELAWARRVLAAAEQDAGAAQVDGQMIDAPVMERARRLLARANRR
ncbi:HpcH/HpaI aldolase/citrate lyase family protein [Salinicola avicenniae]|uniref:HpcH/HpaI aldolase/citrate lyase family protein n=1 Tax=Salinicola avicenniae TaxID=2916836 RepID=UPI002073ACD1|nr:MULTISPECIES: CoA ester lyase [unclassified Salinicola]